MSRRFGWLVIMQDMRAQEHRLLHDLRGKKALLATTKIKAADHFMCKVDDDWELCLGFESGITLVQGQYDLGLPNETKDDDICKKYSSTAVVFRVSVEGTSDTLQFKKFNQGELIQSYTSLQGEEETIGPSLLKNQEGYIDEWNFITEIEKEGVPLERIQELEFTRYNFSPPRSPLPETIAKRWFEFWK